MVVKLIGRESFVWAAGSLCALHRVPFDAELLLRRFPPHYNSVSLQQAIMAYDFKVASQNLPVQDIHPTVFPVLAILKPKTQAPETIIDLPTHVSENPQTEQPQETTNYNLAIVLKADFDRVLLLETSDTSPRTISISEYNQSATGEIILATRQPETVNPDGLIGKPMDSDQAKSLQPFGFKWFIPELLKHKKLWREILLASFAIQIVALATPLGTQVIIDKVVVHHTTSTLIVIAVALGIFLIFNAVMGWVRQYLVLHTGNRIDAVLAHKVFGHLLHLPMRYFEHRPTGTLVARLHGVETIREFLAGTLITLLLDFPFLVVFLVIMFWYSWQLSLISVFSLTLITILSLSITPTLRKKLNHQFLLGARNQSFLTEYVSGMETVKSLQLEPQLEKRYGDYLASYLASTFDAKQLSNTYNITANTLDQTQTLAILCTGAWLVMHNPEFTIGMLVAFQMFSGRLSGPVGLPPI